MWGKSKPKRVNSGAEELTNEDVSEEQWISAESGIPEGADFLAYEPIQRLLAVGTTDGRVRLLGKPGLERTVYSACSQAYGTVHLEFLLNRSLLVRLSEGGSIEAWNLANAHTAQGTARSLSAIKLGNGDRVTTCAAMLRDPFLLLGCASGTLRFAAVVSKAQVLASDLRQAGALQLLPYRVPAAELKGQGALVQLEVQTYGYAHNVLGLHDQAGVCSVFVWDLRAQELRACLSNQKTKDSNPALRRAGPITCCAWLPAGTLGSGLAGGDDSAGAFATGHQGGDVLVWSLPGLMDEEAQGPQAVTCLRVVQGAAEPIRSLRGVRGQQGNLLVLGGQQAGQPDSLTLLHVSNTRGGGEDDDDEEEGHHGGRGAGKTRAKLAYLGSHVGLAILSAPGAISGYEDATCVLQLVDNGQLGVHDLLSSSHGPFALPFQAATPITCTATVLVPGTRQPGMPSYSLSMSGLRVLGQEAGRRAAQAYSTAARSVLKALAGGAPAPPPHDATFSIVYATGYKDGRVRLWEMYGDQPQLLTQVPSAAASTGKLDSIKSVTSLALAWEHGVLVTGHAKGEVRVYQMCDKGKAVDVVALSQPGSKPKVEAKLQEEPGLQLKLRSLVHEGEVTCVSYSPAAKAVVAGDRNGCVSVLDMTRPVVLWLQPPLQSQPIIFAQAAAMAKGSSSEEPAQVVVVSTADARLAVVDLESGQHLGKSQGLAPKNASQALACELLDSQYRPLWLSEPGAALTQEAMWEGWSPRAGGGAAGGRRAGRKAGGGSKAADWKSQLKKGGGGGSDSDDSDDEDDDEDEYLAEAAGQAERDKAAQKKAKMKAVLSLGLAGKKTGGRNRGSTNSLASMGDEGDEGDEEASTSSAAAEHILVVSDGYIRIYSLKCVLSGDRTTQAKVANPTPLIWASAFHVNGTPGLVTMAQRNPGDEVVFQVYSLPGLNLVCEQPLSGALGSTTLTWSPPAGSVHKVSRLVSGSRIGHVLLLAANQELLQLAVTQSLPEPLQPLGVYDWELAMAAHQAAVVHEKSLLQARSNPLGPGRGKGSTLNAGAAAAAVAASGQEGEGEANSTAGRKGFQQLGGMLSKVQQGVITGVTKAFEGTSKGLATVVTTVGTGVQQVGKLFVEGGTDPLQQYHASHPDLVEVLSQVPDNEPPPPSKHRNRHEEDDGIPVTKPLPLASSTSPVKRPVAPYTKPSPRDTGSAPVSARGPGGVRAGAAGGAAAAAGGGRRGGAQDPGDSDESPDSEEEEGAGSRQRGGGRGGRGGTTGGAGAAGTSRRTTRDSAGAGGPPHHQRQGGREEYYDEQEEEHEGGSSMPDIKGTLLGGAQAVVGTLGKLGATAAGAIKTAAQEAAAAAAAAARDPEDYEAASTTSTRKYTSGEPSSRPRTTAEIRASYGRGGGGAGDRGTTSERARATNQRVSEVAQVAHETRNKLIERGEKLKQLDEKASEVHNEAAGFADLARQLAEQQRNRKWWQ